jgi:chromosome segregation ATPase
MAKKARQKPVEATTTARKAEIDAELEAYAQGRKKEIKDEILAKYRELETTKKELAGLYSELESIKTQLGEMQAVYTTEETELKELTEEAKKKKAEAKTEIAALETKTEEAREALGRVEYQKTQAEIALTRTREEHKKFVKYETDARAKLDARKRELDNQAAEISTSKEFLKNKRTTLAEL